MKRLTIAAAFIVASVGLLASFGGVAAADTISPNPITFEPPTYTTGDINGQQGWMKTGSYDAAVASVATFPAAAGYGFGDQALRVSDAVTSGSFGDQTFSPGLTEPAAESSAQTHFQASFQIGTTSAGVQPGLHMSVSPDDGNGARMSYLRFEDRADGVHVFFDDTTDSGPVGTGAAFNESDIATLSRSSAHTLTFDITFKTNAADVVNIYIDGSYVKTGTTWEDYYRYDPEQTGSGNVVPGVSKLLFRESGDATPANLGHGFLIDGVSLTSSAARICTPTGFTRDGINMTAAQIGGNVTGDLDAGGCNIGVYYNTSTGNVTGANIHGANYFGVVVNGDVGTPKVNVTSSNIHDIGETPLNGTQHGNAIYYRALGTGTASGTISGNAITHYQKGGITTNGNVFATITNNAVTGQGPVNYIAQNGIQVGYGAKATVTGNIVTGNAYTGANLASSAGILVVGGPAFSLPYTVGLDISKNSLTGNDVGVWLYNADASGNAPATKTNNSVKFNTISNAAVTNTTGYTATCGYQAGISDLGTKDQIVSNTISGFGYTPTVGGDCNGATHAFLRFIDAGSSARGVGSNK
ncbi:MAG: hypothetical protein QOG69_1348 [Actinomycetota bacterium]|jgi:hypothetical protein|nr:hypothetical protein [Actinomycetota bacterium]